MTEPKTVSQTTPDNDAVICPKCAHQFVAIPVNVQAALAQRDAPQADRPVDCSHNSSTRHEFKQGVRFYCGISEAAHNIK